MNLIEQSYVFPHEIVEQQANHPLLQRLHICRAGYFPHFTSHVTVRPQGFPDSHIIIYCTNGQGWFESGGQRWTITKGQILFVLMGVPHGYGANEDDPWSIQWAHFGGDEVDAFLSWLNITPKKPTLFDWRKFANHSPI